MNKWTDAQWVEECKFIADVTDVQGKTAQFNHDTECFRRYFDMQAKEADKQGFNDSAEYIRQCMDDLK